jgi:hypothetical protein
MPRRFPKKTYEVIYKLIANRDGEHCLVPGCRKGPPQGKLEIDHADNNPRNWDPDNLHLLCKRHNLAMRELTSRQHVATMRRYSALNVCVCECEKGSGGVVEVGQVVDYRNGSIEMQANSYLEGMMIDFFLTTINDQGQADKKDLINSAAQYARGSPVTAKRYLEKLTSSFGPLTETRDGFGNIVIVFKPRCAPSGVTRMGANGPARGKSSKSGHGDTVTITRASRGGKDSGTA